MAGVCAVVKTNLDLHAIPADLLPKLSTWLMNTLRSDLQNTTMELEAGVSMLRAGTRDPLVNIYLHHNCDLGQPRRQEMAGQIAVYMAQHLPVKTDRVLVLFFDTRNC